MCSGCWPGSSRQSTSSSQTAGMTFRLIEAETIVGEKVAASSASTESGGAGGPLAENDAEKGLPRGRELRLRAERSEPLDQARGLDESVVGDARHRRVARAAEHAQAERCGHLLRDRCLVDRRTVH